MTVNAILRQGNVFHTAPLTQYDEGQKIHLSGVELPASYLAEFANSESGTAEQIAQTTDTVTVPDKYLTSGNPVYVWIVVVGQDERTTRYEIIIPVRGRGEPDDYTPTPSEQTAIEAAIAALNSAVTAAGVAIEHYPKIVDGYWYVWDVTAGEWISTEVGATGNGIAGAKLNEDYTLTLAFTDGTSYTTPSIRGEKGDTGATPAFSIGTVTTGAAGSSASATITGTPEAPALNLTIPRGDPGEVTQAEFDELKSALTTVVENINLIDPTTIVDHSYCNGQNPTAGSYSRTGLVGVKPETDYTFANTSSNYWETSSLRARFICFYDNSGTYISRVESTTNFTTPEQCAFVMISFYENARAVVLIEGTYDTTTQNMVYVPYNTHTLKVNSDEIADLSVENIVDYAVPGKNLFNPTAITEDSFLYTYPGIVSNNISFVSDYIKVKSGITYVISNHNADDSAGIAVRSYVLYDNNFQKVSGSSGDVATLEFTPTVDGYIRFTGYKVNLSTTQVEAGSTPTDFEPYRPVYPNKALLNDEQIAQVGNVLFRKKWAVCGDSFTAAGGTNTKITEGKYIGKNYTYPWIIGNRNDMSVVPFCDGGKTLAFPAVPGSFTNSLTNPNSSKYYQNIPADADYITIYLGINDEHHAPGSSGGDGEDNTGEIPIGTIGDATTATYLGAWNVVLTWLITNRPNAHIGIIVTNGIAEKDEYRLGQIAIAQKYGIPYIDMNGDSRTPAMLRTSNPNIPAAIKQALIYKWAVDPATNTHPNDAAQLFESYFIENFLRSI